jgi:hypothetical protein
MLEHDTRVITAYEDLRRAFYLLDKAADDYRKVRGWWNDHLSSLNGVPAIGKKDWRDWHRRIEEYEGAATMVEEAAWRLSFALLKQASRIEEEHDL